MQAQYLAQSHMYKSRADVAVPQAAAFAKFPCQSGALSTIVDIGRSQATLASDEEVAQSALPANKWSRGCRALKLPFLHCAWLAFWPLVPRKLKMWFTLISQRLTLASSQPKPANTSKSKGRAPSGLTVWPALILFATSGGSAIPPRFPQFGFSFRAIAGNSTRLEDATC
jgi:hypothetical protein